METLTDPTPVTQAPPELPRRTKTGDSAIQQAKWQNPGESEVADEFTKAGFETAPYIPKHGPYAENRLEEPRFDQNTSRKGGQITSQAELVSVIRAFRKLPKARAEIEDATTLGASPAAIKTWGQLALRPTYSGPQSPTTEHGAQPQNPVNKQDTPPRRFDRLLKAIGL